jgi:hypothetical protein
LLRSIVQSSRLAAQLSACRGGALLGFGKSYETYNFLQTLPQA